MPEWGKSRLPSSGKIILLAFLFLVFFPSLIIASGQVAQLNASGLYYARQGDLIRAIQVWRYAVDLDKNNVHLYNNIGSALQRLGSYQQAFVWYQAALRIKPTYWTYYNISLLYRNFRQGKEEIWSLQKALSLKNDFSYARERLNSLNKQIPVKEPVNSNSLLALKSDSRPLIVKKINPVPKILAKESNKPQKIRHKAIKLPTDAGGQVFLTFDGGADDDGYEAIIENLARFGVKSTFFLTGKFVQRYPDKARNILAQGHEIANHSMNHLDMKKWSKEKIAKEIELAEQAFEKILGQRGAPYFRFPFGHQNKRVERFVEELGYRPVYWHIDTIDWREDAVKTIISRVSRKLRRGSVILMHVGSKNGAKALPIILQEIVSRGYNPVRLTDLDPNSIASLP